MSFNSHPPFYDIISKLMGDSSSEGENFIFKLESSQSLMVENFRLLSIVKSEMEGENMRESNAADEEHQVWHLTVAVGVERIIT